LADAEPTAKRSDLPVRTASALVMLTLAGSAFWLGGWVLAGFIVAVGLGILVEWGLLVRAFERRPGARLAWIIGGLGYIGLAVVTALREVESPISLLLVVASVIAVDVGAYFAGRTIGGPKIAPAISPSKTWAGLGGGMAGAIALNLAWSAWAVHRQAAVMAQLEQHYGPAVRAMVPPIAWGQVLIGGALTAIVAQSGDFFESWMKRRAGVKDSSHLIPGHGGLFDRGDGLIAVLFAAGLIQTIVAVIAR
jgi:phosphatidate cytidylyltransferase